MIKLESKHRFYIGTRMCYNDYLNKVVYVLKIQDKAKLHFRTFCGTQFPTDTILQMVIGLKVKAENSKYMLMSHHQTAVESHGIRRVTIPSENVVKLKYLGMRVTNQNLITEE